jgi:uncharacterized membrane protein
MNRISVGGTNRFFLIVTGTILLSCKHDPLPGPNSGKPVDEGPCDPGTVYFVNQVLPILQSNCAIPGCHDAATASDGVILSNYDDIINTGKVKAGKPNDSKIIKVMTESGGDRMPPENWGPALTPEQIAIISTWISQGAKNNVCEDLNCDTTNVTYTTSIADIITTSCVGCHKSPSPSGGVDLSSYSGVYAVAMNGKLVNVVTGTTKLMPPGNKMPPCKISKIQKWVSVGAPQ